eukprot:Rmarinus@m.6294
MENITMLLSKHHSSRVVALSELCYQASNNAVGVLGLIQIDPYSDVAGDDQILTGHVYNVGALSISPCGKRLVSGGDDAQTRLWNLQTGECLMVFQGTGISKLVWISKSLKNIISCSRDRLSRWDTVSGKCLSEIRKDFSNASGICISRDGQYLAVASFEKFVEVYHISDGPLCRYGFGRDRIVTFAVSFSPM